MKQADAEKLVRHPIRVQIVAQLATKPKMSPKELAKELDVSLGVVAYHVRTLQEMGALKSMGTKQRRGATEHYYALRKTAQKPMVEAAHKFAGNANVVLAVLT
jgi:predicted transcriptional regulator